jgi:hypothetical protein
MTHPGDAAVRGRARKPGSVIAPTARTDKAKASGYRKQPCASPAVRLQLARPTGGCADFRYYLDSRGYQHFNFKQRLWPNPSVRMAVTPVMTIALETLAVNLLAHVTGERSDRACPSINPRRLARLARRFCAQCLLTACPAGWVIPRCTIEAWLASQHRLPVPMPNAIRRRKAAPDRVLYKK